MISSQVALRGILPHLPRTTQPVVEMLEGRLLMATSFAISIGGDGDDRCNDIGLDRNGNIYIVGSFANTVDFDPRAGKTANRTAQARDIYLAKYSKNGKFRWVRTISTPRDDLGTSLAVRPNGTVAITGRSTVNDIGDDAHIRVFNTDGKLKWQKLIDGDGAQFAKGVAFNRKGDVYVTGGYVDNDIDFDGTPLANEGSADVFISRFRKNGRLRWARSISGVSFDVSEGIAVDADRNVIVSGFFSGLTDFDPSTTGFQPLQSSGPGIASGFVQKLDGNGNFEWVQRISSVGDAFVWDVAVDSNDDAVVVVDFNGAATFGDEPGAAVVQPGTGGHGAGISKISSDGEFVWTNGVEGGVNHSAHHLAIDRKDDIHVTGLFQGTPDFDFSDGVGTATAVGEGINEFILKLTSDGDFVWVQGCEQGSPQLLESREIAVNRKTNPFIGGRFIGTFSLDRLGSDKDPLTGTGEEILILKLKKNGELA